MVWGAIVGGAIAAAGAAKGASEQRKAIAKAEAAAADRRKRMLVHLEKAYHSMGLKVLAIAQARMNEFANKPQLSINAQSGGRAIQDQAGRSLEGLARSKSAAKIAIESDTAVEYDPSGVASAWGAAGGSIGQMVAGLDSPTPDTEETPPTTPGSTKGNPRTVPGSGTTTEDPWQWRLGKQLDRVNPQPSKAMQGYIAAKEENAQRQMRGSYAARNIGVQAAGKISRTQVAPTEGQQRNRNGIVEVYKNGKWTKVTTEFK